VIKTEIMDKRDESHYVRIQTCNAQEKERKKFHERGEDMKRRQNRRVRHEGQKVMYACLFIFPDKREIVKKKYAFRNKEI
jgi:hypothetical protein